MNKDDKRTRSFNKHMWAFNKRITNPLLRAFANASRGTIAIMLKNADIGTIGTDLTVLLIFALVMIGLPFADHAAAAGLR